MKSFYKKLSLQAPSVSVRVVLQLYTIISDEIDGGLMVSLCIIVLTTKNRGTMGSAKQLLFITKIIEKLELQKLNRKTIAFS